MLTERVSLGMKNSHCLSICIGREKEKVSEFRNAQWGLSSKEDNREKLRAEDGEAKRTGCD